MTALGKFVRLSRITLPVGEPTELALKAVASQNARICPLECASDEIVVDSRCVVRAQGRRNVEPRRPRAHIRVCTHKNGQLHCRWRPRS
jgi:hypothetical protein